MEEKPRRSLRVWRSIAVGLVIFTAGLYAGFFGRGLIMQDVPGRALGTPIPLPAQAAAAGQAAKPTNSAETVAKAVASTRHWLGDPKAPVTLIEFSDFQ